MSDAEAVADVAQRYARLIALWREARAGAATDRKSGPPTPASRPTL
jgi:myo-inositol catabolism protein IolC